jgi:hypothetical protein
MPPPIGRGDTGDMPLHSSKGRRSRSRTKRVLLVGLTPFTMSVLEGPLGDVADVSVVPFPGESFDHAADDFQPDLTIVDVTYLDQTVVRPLITHRLLPCRSKVVYLSASGAAWLDDLATLASGPLEDASIRGLTNLIGGPTLTLIEGGE